MALILKLVTMRRLLRSYQKLILPVLMCFFLCLLLMESLDHQDNSSGFHDDSDSVHSNKDVIHSNGIGRHGNSHDDLYSNSIGGSHSNSIRPVYSESQDVFSQRNVKEIFAERKGLALNFRKLAAVMTRSVFTMSRVNSKNMIPQRNAASHINRTDSQTTKQKTNKGKVTLRPFEQTINVLAFTPVLSPSERRTLLGLARKLDEVAKDLGATYFMYGGSLLGSFRHHDLIPWDDDIDVLVDIADRTKLYHQLKHLGPEYDVFWAGPRLKFFSEDSTTTSRYPWKWPYVDIHFYRQNETHIWDSAKEFRSYIYEKSYTFPLHRRPLGSIHLNAPRDSFRTLRDTYKNTSDSCETHFYSHKAEGLQEKRYRLPCEMLKDRLGFVHRSSVPEGGVTETLRMGDNVLHSVVVDEPSYAITKPFSLELL